MLALRFNHMRNAASTAQLLSVAPALERASVDESDPRDCST
jgi:hypothetical protein